MSMYTWRDMLEALDFRELDDVREKSSYAIQSQYAASAKIRALCAGFQLRIEPQADIDLFYDKMFNIYTAEGFGLDNWGVILQIGRQIIGPPSGDCFGFDKSGLHPFNQYPFTPDTGLVESTYVTLDDEMFRLLLLYKALANISASDAATQNRLLATLINSGVGDFPEMGYVIEVDTMVIRWVFEDFLTPTQQAVFRAAGTLARGAGVGWQIYAINKNEVLGFVGSELQPFNQGIFAPDKALIDYRD